MQKTEDLNNQKFGRLTVHSRKWCEEKKRHLWYCQCECGNFTYVPTSDLLSGKTKSCGCFRKEVTSAKRKTHGMSNSRLYGIWNAIKARCTRKTNVQYKDYGGRGITICDEWLNSFEAFCEWSMANGYSDDLTIDRIDVNSNYCPENCRWATEKEQSNNKRNNHLLTYNGKTQTLQQWSNEVGIPEDTLLYRIQSGWALEYALTLPPNFTKKNKHLDVRKFN